MASRYGWVIVAAGAIITCVAMGAMFALPVYLQPIAEDTGWSHAGISFAMTIGFIVMGVAGFLWGTLSDRIGPRPVVLIAAAMLGAGLFIASRASDLVVFQLAYEFTKTNDGKSLAGVTNFLPAQENEDHAHALLLGAAFGF